MRKDDIAEWTPVSRRQALAGIGTVATGAIGTAVIAQPAGATVSVDEFTVKSNSFDAEQVDPIVTATIGYDYDVGTAPVADVRVSLSIDGTEVAQETMATNKTTYQSSVELSGRIADSGQWSVGHFEPSAGASVSREVSVTVRFAVRDSDGRVIKSATASDTAEVTVTHPESGQTYVTVGGSAEIKRQ
jgi:hypothetical protein